MWNNRIGERYAYMGAEGCSASARAFQGVRFHWPHTIRVYFVLSPKFLGTCYWCAIKIFVLFFAVSAGRRKRQKTKPGPAPTYVQGGGAKHAQGGFSDRKTPWRMFSKHAPGGFFNRKTPLRMFCPPPLEPPSATPIWGPKAARQALRSSRGLGGSFGTTLGFILSLVPQGRV